MDLRFPNHKNEIVQAEAATGKKFVNYWIHIGILTINGEKMSKSLGNIVNVKDLLKTWDPEVIRFFFAQAHYRSPPDFSEKALKKAEEFFSSHCAYNGFLVKEMKLPDGSFLGYELTPDYPASLCEDGNELRVSYGLGEGGEIKVYTWLLLKAEEGRSNNLPAQKK